MALIVPLFSAPFLLIRLRCRDGIGAVLAIGITGAVGTKAEVVRVIGEAGPDETALFRVRLRLKGPAGGV